MWLSWHSDKHFECITVVFNYIAFYILCSILTAHICNRTSARVHWLIGHFPVLASCFHDSEGDWC